MKKFMDAEIEIIKFTAEDIITTSGDDFGEMGDDQMPWG